MPTPDRSPPDQLLRRTMDWPTATVILFALGILAQSGWLVGMAALVASVGLIASTWARLALVRLTYQRTMQHSHVFAGESTTLEIRLTNAKLLPLPWVRAQDLVQIGLDFGGRELTAAERPYRNRLQHLAALGPYRHVIWRFVVTCPTRGIYRFGPAQLSAGDLFGIYEATCTLPATLRLVVYPRIRTLLELGFPAGDPFGGDRSKQPLVRDPLRPVGIRDYRPEDSRRQVHWKATARTGALKVKVWEPVSAQALMIILNMATFDQHWLGVNPDLQELAIQVAGAVARHATDQGYAIGLAANGALPEVGRPIRVPAGHDARALPRVLEALAAVTSFVHPAIQLLVASESRRAPWGATLVVVSAVVAPALEQVLMRLQRAGRRMVLVSLDRRYQGQPAGVLTYHLAPEALAAQAFRPSVLAEPVFAAHSASASAPDSIIV